jgi:hypothetical protein|tara:strand:- start:179 stop:706 length:528 start_codon:yes stop_codon:yes gene_type:complete
MPNINDFKAKLAGGGARANQFKVTMPFPGYAQVGGEIEDLAFLCRATTLPGMDVPSLNVPFRGRSIKIAGDRTVADWSVTAYNDTNFRLRNAFERWQNGINNMTDNEGLTNPVDYQVDAFVDHLDRNGNTIKSYTLRGVFPTAIAPIELTYDEATAIEEFSVTFAYQYFETNTTT